MSDAPLESPQHLRRRWVGKVGLTLLSVTLTLALVEVGFRIAVPERVEPFFGFAIYPDNPRGYFEPCDGGRPGFCVPDSPDFVSCHARHDPKRGTLLVLGDSFSSAQGVRANDTFAQHLGTVLAGARDRPSARRLRGRPRARVSHLPQPAFGRMLVE